MNREETIKFIVDKYKLDMTGEMPIRIPNSDRHHDLVDLYRELGYKEGAEIGVAAGSFADCICSHNPGVKLHCVDSWEKYPGYNDFKKSYFEPAEKETRERLAKYNCNIIKKYSLDAVKDFEDGQLDFVYIDANHDVRHVIDDIDEWSKKIRPGGMISGHDWALSMHAWKQLQVVPALDAWTKAWRIEPWFVLGRDERLPNERRQGHRSWFYII